ncbi:hypothetical protein AAE478_009006, partial [Parahypoxylon ruwenzoriense]
MAEHMIKPKLPILSSPTEAVDTRPESSKSAAAAVLPFPVHFISARTSFRWYPLLEIVSAIIAHRVAQDPEMDVFLAEDVVSRLCSLVYAAAHPAFLGLVRTLDPGHKNR